MQKHGGIWLALLLALLAAAVLAPVAAMASEPEGIPIDEDHFPDDEFREYVISQLAGGDNVLTPKDIAKATEIEVRSEDISDLTGIEYFTELKELDCYDNQLMKLDVSQNTKLETLNCSYNQLTELDVSGCKALKTLECYSNRFTSLNVSGCMELGLLNCSDNQLTSLDVSKNTEMKTLDCSDNQLTSLDVSQNAALTYLYCSDNQLTSLDVSKNTALVWLDCSNNQLTSLDVSLNTKLNTLDCSPPQTARLGVNRSADGTWPANLAALIGPNVSNVQTSTSGATAQGTTVTWSVGVQPTVTYDYNTGHNNQTMNVTLTLVPLGVGTEADVTGATVKSIAGVISGTEITVTLPAGSPLPTAGDIAVTLSRYATMTAPATADGDRTWTFTVTSEDEQTVKKYTLYIVYGVTVESGEDGHGTVTASPNPAREGDTVTLTVTPDPGYMLTGWEVVLGDVSVREDNTFVMPGGAVILRPVFAPIPATPPQTGDDSHTGLWLALALVSLGGLCAAAWTARKRRGGAR